MGVWLSVKRKRWKRIGIMIGSAVVVMAAVVYFITYTGPNIFPNVNKKHALLRLEDVGPGGEYDTPEGLGKLRAVLSYIASEDIPFHVAVIPRRMEIDEDGHWQEKGIDDPDPDPIVKSFIQLLQEAQASGGLLGMHGYTHQFGGTARPDNAQNSGTGAEFKVGGAPREASYAAERITASLAAFAKDGLQPAFWESPHYKDTREQEEVFRSFVGLLYQPDLFSLRSFKDLTAYDNTNHYGQISLGSVYVPAPYKYVSDSTSVDRMLARAKKDNALASLYFHPFLDFPFLEEATGPDGKPEVKDGLPVYRYKEDGSPSYLHRIIQGFEQEGYRWMSLYDIIPFSPAHRVTLPPGTSAGQVLLGDVTGHGHADVVVREDHRVIVIPGTYTWPRNRPQEAAQVWLQETLAPEEQLLLADLDGDGKQDLLAYNRQTGNLRAARAGDGRFLPFTPLGTLPGNLASLQPLQSIGEGPALIAREEDKLIYISIAQNHASAVKTGSLVPADSVLYAGAFGKGGSPGILAVSPSQPVPVRLDYQGSAGFANPQPAEGIRITAGEQLLAGDPNGDGRSDLITYTPKTGVWRVYENSSDGTFHALDNDFGPWAQGTGRIALAADMDGNGKTDIASYEEKGHALDFALSFRGITPSSK